VELGRVGPKPLAVCGGCVSAGGCRAANPSQHTAGVKTVVEAHSKAGMLGEWWDNHTQVIWFMDSGSSCVPNTLPAKLVFPLVTLRLN